MYFLSILCLLKTVVSDSVVDYTDSKTTMRIPTSTGSSSTTLRIATSSLKSRGSSGSHKSRRRANPLKHPAGTTTTTTTTTTYFDPHKSRRRAKPLKHPAGVERSGRVPREVYHYEINIHNSSCQLDDPEDPMFYMCGSKCISVEEACDGWCNNIGAERWMCYDGKQCLRKYLYYEYLEGVPTEPAHGDRWSHGRCMDRKGCYKNYLCDGTIQCGDGSDEYLLTCYQELWWIWVLIAIIILGIALVVSLFCLGWCVCSCRKSSKERVSESTTITMEF